MEKTARLAGFASAEAVLRASESEALVPTIYYENSLGMRYDVVFDSSLPRGGLAEALDWLLENPESVRCAALYYDGVLDLEGVASDAIIVEIRDYSEAGITELSLAVPYRSVKDEEGFGVYSPEFLSGDSAEIHLETFFEQFFEGFEDHREGTQVWASAFLDTLGDV